MLVSRSERALLKAIFWQWLLAIIFVLVLLACHTLKNWSIAVLVSGLLGCLVVLLPNSFMVAYLVWPAVVKRSLRVVQTQQSPVGFMFAEVLKVVATLGLMLLVVYRYADLQWGVFLLGMLVIFKSYFFILLRHNR